MGIHFGKDARKRGEERGISWTLQYVDGEESICLARTGVVRSKVLSLHGDRKYGVVVIGLRAIYKYTGETREEKEFLVCQAIKFAEIMGFDPHSKFDVFNILTVIDKLIIEVVTMQPEPISMRKTDGELIDLQIEDAGDRQKIEMVIQ
jgi:hypothetical protein